jgi:hypothetical protein
VNIRTQRNYEGKKVAESRTKEGTTSVVEFTHAQVEKASCEPKKDRNADAAGALHVLASVSCVAGRRVNYVATPSFRESFASVSWGGETYP